MNQVYVPPGRRGGGQNSTLEDRNSNETMVQVQVKSDTPITTISSVNNSSLENEVHSIPFENCISNEIKALQIFTSIDSSEIINNSSKIQIDRDINFKKGYPIENNELSQSTSKILKISNDKAVEEFGDIRECCILAHGFHSDLPEYSKSILLKPFVDKGALVRWISSTEAILVFSSEMQARSSLSVSHNSLIKIQHLPNIMDKSKVKSLCDVGKELQNEFFIKSGRDITVANRMIGAALGIKLPVSVQIPKSKSQSDLRKDRKEKEEKLISDFWEDS